MSRRNSTLIFILIFMVAMCARLVPVHMTSLPYNIDGYPLVRISEIISETGSLPDPVEYDGLLRYNMKLPVFSLLLSMFSLVTGMEPMAFLPYFCALMGSAAVLFIYVLARSITRNELAAFSAGMFAALTGLFVYVTTIAIKQVLGMALLCFIFYLYTRRRDWRFRMAMILALSILPFVHHLSTLIAMLALSFALVGTAFRRSEHHVRTLWEFMLDIITGPGILMLSLVYYRSVNLEIASEIFNADDIMLLASVSLIMAVMARLLSMTVQTKPWFFLAGKDKKIGLSTIFDEKVLILVIGIGGLYLNSRFHLFTGGQLTSDGLLRLMLPYMVLAVIGLMGFNVLRYSKFPQRHLVVGMYFAPLTVMLFSMLNGMDLFGYMMAYRAYNFIDIPLAITAGVGIAYIFGRLASQAKKHDFFKTVPYFAVAIFLLLCVMAFPFAYNTEAAFSIRDVTETHEFEAMEWASEHVSGVILTDQRYGESMAPYFGASVDKTGPWKMRDGGFAEGDVVLASREWTRIGAQMYPFGQVVLREERYNMLLTTCNVCYVGGPPGHEAVVFIVP
jgi:hypothetical protein